ncbi:MAG: cytochrome c553 [bacterium]|jgi:cytochrome c553
MKSSFEKALSANRQVPISGSATKTSLLLRAGVFGLLAIALVPLSQANAAGDVAAGEQKGHTCLGCHGVQHYVNTYPTYHVPLISGQHEAYLVAALQSYRAKTRSHPTMQANAALLTDQDIADIAAWLSSQGAK